MDLPLRLSSWLTLQPMVASGAPVSSVAMCATSEHRTALPGPATRERARTLEPVPFRTKKVSDSGPNSRLKDSRALRVRIVAVAEGMARIGRDQGFHHFRAGAQIVVAREAF